MALNATVQVFAWQYCFAKYRDGLAMGEMDSILGFAKHWGTLQLFRFFFFQSELPLNLTN